MMTWRRSLLVWLFSFYLLSAVSCMHCFFPTNTTRLVEMPDNLECRCDHDNETIELMSDLRSMFDSFLVDGLSSLRIVHCHKLSLNVVKSISVNLTVGHINELEMKCSEAPVSLLAINISRLAFSQQHVVNANWTSSSLLSFSMDSCLPSLAVAVLLSVLVTTTLNLLVMHFCCTKTSKNVGPEHQKSLGCLCCHVVRRKRPREVMRVGSWRYEANVNVNPNERERSLRHQRRLLQDHSTTAALHQLLPLPLIMSTQAQSPNQPDPQAQLGSEQPDMGNTGDDDTDVDDLQQRDQSYSVRRRQEDGDEVPWERRLSHLAYADDSGPRASKHSTSNSYSSEHNQPTLPRADLQQSRQQAQSRPHVRDAE